MCATCGCDTEVAGGHDHDHDHAHAHGHDHAHGHAHDHVHDGRDHPESTATTRTKRLEYDLLAKNQRAADANRTWLAERDITLLNVMGSPGAGKTTLLERSIRALGRVSISVIEGDQATSLDAARIAKAGARAVQVNTGAGCHLDATMVSRALDTLAPSSGSLVFVENVGNLVCPSLFDLGETAKVVVMSVTEGDDKPLKYPHAFRSSSLFVLTKLDLSPHVDFDIELCSARAIAIHPELEILRIDPPMSAGIRAFTHWVERTMAERSRAVGA